MTGTRYNIVICGVMFNITSFWLFALCILHQWGYVTNADTDRVQRERDLWSYIMHREYSPYVIPLRNMTSSLKVSMGMTLFYIRELRAKDQFLQMSVWVQMEWQDDYISWDPDDFNGASKIAIQPERIWRPDVALYNSLDVERSVVTALPDSDIMVHYTGSISWVSAAVLKSSCIVDVAAYPFDTQHCNLTFGTWLQRGGHVNLTHITDRVDTSNYIENGEWELISAKSVRVMYMDACCKNPVTEIVYMFVLRRKPLFYIVHLLYPCLLMVFIGNLVFCMPSESGEKIGLAINVLLSLTVFMLVVMDYIPTTSQVISLFDIFFAFAVLVLGVIAALAIGVTYIHFRGALGVHPPLWLANAFLKLAPRAVFIEETIEELNIARYRRAHREKVQAWQKLAQAIRKPRFADVVLQKQNKDKMNVGGTEAKDKSSSVITDTQSPSIIRQILNSLWKSARSPSKTGGKPFNRDELEPLKQSWSRTSFSRPNEDIVVELNRILCTMMRIRRDAMQEIMATERPSFAKIEWELIAMVTDRICFFLCTILTVCLSMVMFYT